MAKASSGLNVKALNLSRTLKRVLTYFVGPIVLFDPWLQANVQVQLIFLVVASPCHFFKTVWLCVDEFGVLGNRLVWVPVRKILHR